MTEKAIPRGASGDSATPEAAPETASGKERSEAPPGEAGPTAGSSSGSSPGGAGPGDDAARGAGGRSLQDRVLRVQASVDGLLQRFDEKLLHDEARTNEIKRLNAELARHQPDARWATARVFVDQMVRHLDEIQRFAHRYDGRDDPTPATEFLQALNWLHENIELALEEHGITPFRPQAGKDAFDGRRHSVAGSPVPTTDAKLSRVIERCVRPGFELGDRIVARASVKIYRHDDTPDSNIGTDSHGRPGDPDRRS